MRSFPKLLIFLILPTFIFFSCSESIIDNSEEGILSPSFIEDIAVTKSRAIYEVSGQQEINKLYMFWYSPAIATFEKRKLINNQTYDVMLANTKVPIVYSKGKNGIHEYKGISEDKSISISVTYNSLNNTYDFQNIILLSVKINGEEQKQAFITKGKDIPLDNQGNSHGMTEFYTYLTKNDLLVFGTGEFIANSIISGYTTHKLGSIERNTENPEYKVFSFDLEGAQNIVDYVLLQDEVVSRNDYYSLFWFDKKSTKFKRAPLPSEDELEGDEAAAWPFDSKDEAQKKVTEISNGTWVLLENSTI